MGNIYLRINSLYADYYRGEDSNNLLLCSDPYVFTPGTHPYNLLIRGLHFTTINEQIVRGCFSQNTWKTMCIGKSPVSSSKVLNRNPDTWLTSEEVCLLTNTTNNDKLNSSDFLCIEIPKQIYREGRFYPTNDNYALDRSSAAALRKFLIANFKSVFYDWYLANKRVEEELNVNRTNIDLYERFLEAHNIRGSRTGKERDSLRKMLERKLAPKNCKRSLKELKNMEALRIIYTDEKKSIASK